MSKKEEKAKKPEVKKIDKTKANDKKPKVKKESFFKGLKKELSNVKWPNAKDVLKYTIATLVFCFVLALFFQLLDIISSFIKGLFS